MAGRHSPALRARLALSLLFFGPHVLAASTMHTQEAPTESRADAQRKSLTPDRETAPATTPKLISVRKSKPNSAAAHVRLGIALRKRGELSAAAWQFDTAAKLE